MSKIHHMKITMSLQSRSVRPTKTKVKFSSLKTFQTIVFEIVDHSASDLDSDLKSDLISDSWCDAMVDICSDPDRDLDRDFERDLERDLDRDLERDLWRDLERDLELVLYVVREFKVGVGEMSSGGATLLLGSLLSTDFTSFCCVDNSF